MDSASYIPDYRHIWALVLLIHLTIKNKELKQEVRNLRMMLMGRGMNQAQQQPQQQMQPPQIHFHAADPNQQQLAQPPPQQQSVGLRRVK